MFVPLNLVLCLNIFRHKLSDRGYAQEKKKLLYKLGLRLQNARLRTVKPMKYHSVKNNAGF